MNRDLFLVVGGIFLVLVCCAPDAGEFVKTILKQGVNCKAQITVPEGVREGETIDVDVKLYDCGEVQVEPT